MANHSESRFGREFEKVRDVIKGVVGALVGLIAPAPPPVLKPVPARARRRGSPR